MTAVKLGGPLLSCGVGWLGAEKRKKGEREKGSIRNTLDCLRPS